MFVWLLLGGICTLILWSALNKAVKANNPQARSQAFASLVVVLLAVVGVMLLLTGKLLAAAPALVSSLFGLWRLGALARLFRNRASWSKRRQGAGGEAGGKDGSARGASSVESPYLQMRLDHETGALDGVVRRGRFVGRRLSHLGFAEIMVLGGELNRQDPEGLRLLEAFLDREHGPDWRARAEAEGYGGAGEGAREQAGPGGAGPGGGMTRQEALEVLGLDADAGDEAVRKAHKQLMLKLHPDRGGSDYFAAKVNEAKDILLGRRRAG